MTVIWRVDDGYTGRREHHTEIDDDALADYDTEDGKQEYINDCIQEDFEQKVSWVIISTIKTQQ